MLAQRSNTCDGIGNSVIASQWLPVNADMNEMQRFFATHSERLFGAAMTIERCDIAHSHHKIYRKTTSRHKDTHSVCHRLILRDVLNGRRRTTFVYTKAYRAGLSHAAFLALELQRLHALHLPHQDIIAWPFPADPALAQLPHLVDAQHVLAHLPYHTLTTYFAGPRDIAGVDIDVVSYRPEQRCLTRYTLHHTSGDAALQVTLYGKTFACDIASAVFQRVDHLWRHTRSSESPLRVPRPLAIDAATHTVWMDAVPGISLAEAINSDLGEARIEAAARTLATLHSLRVPMTGPVVTCSDLLTDATKKCNRLMHVFEPFATLLPIILRDLESALPRLSSTSPGTIHGDCHARQFIVSDDTATLVDFDELAQGDPHQDIANFTVDLATYRLPALDAERLARAFVGEYRRHSAFSVRPGRLAWHALVQWINRAHRANLRQSARLHDELTRIQVELERARHALRTTLAQTLGAPQ